MVQNWRFFQLFFVFGNRSQENVFYEILERENALLGYRNKKFKKSKNWHFSKGVNPLFWSKNGHFPNIFLGDRGHENVFYEFVERKNAFLGYKNKKFKSRKIDIFPNWHFLTHGFVPKMAFFANFYFLGHVGQENVFYEILERKNAFLGCKNNKFKKSKNWHFSKGVNPWFWSKNGHFSNFYFLGNIGQENVFYDILERKNAYLGYKYKKV